MTLSQNPSDPQYNVWMPLEGTDVNNNPTPAQHKPIHQFCQHLHQHKLNAHQWLQLIVVMEQI